MTVAGTAAAPGLLLVRVTTSPPHPDRAGPVNVTVPVKAVPDVGLIVNEATDGAAGGAASICRWTRTLNRFSASGELTVTQPV